MRDGHRAVPAGCFKVVSSLYDKLERVVLPLFYGERERFPDVMLHAIALNGSFFHTRRMMLQYVLKAYS
jgi:glycogen phosphorylase